MEIKVKYKTANTDHESKIQIMSSLSAGCVLFVAFMNQMDHSYQLVMMDVMLTASYITMFPTCFPTSSSSLLQ